MIFFYSRADLEQCIRLHLQPEDDLVQSDELPVTESVDALGGSFPGWVSVPAWLRPTDYYLLQARRADGRPEA